MNDWTAARRDYRVALIAAGRSPGTIRLHMHYLDELERSCSSPWRATHDDLVRVLARPGWSPETRKSCRSVLASFYRWAHGSRRLAQNPAEGLPSVSVPAGRARPTPEQVVARALELAGPRERLMVKAARQCGLRACEVATIHSRALEGDMLRVTGKGGRVRLVPVLDDELRAAIRAANGWLFPGRIDGHLSPAYVSRLLGQALAETWTGHTLRHAYGTAAYRGSRDLLAVGELLGHARPETTKRYVLMPDDAMRAAALAAQAA